MVGRYDLTQTFGPTTCKGSAAPFAASNSPHARQASVLADSWRDAGLPLQEWSLDHRFGACSPYWWFVPALCGSLQCLRLCFSPDLIRGSPREFWSHASEASHLATPHAACWASQVKGRRTITAFTHLSRAVRNHIELYPLSWQQMLGWLVLGFGQPLVRVCCSMFD